MGTQTETLLLPSQFLDEPSKVRKSNEKKIAWDREWTSSDVFYCLGVSGLHILSLFAPFTFSWSAVGVAVAVYILTGLFGLTLCFHRNLSHKSFELPKYLEYLFAYLGLHSLQGDPVWWVSHHRNHHKYTDTYGDPHSPVDGFWMSHIFWLFDSKHALRKGGSYANVRDLTKQRYYRFLRQTFVFHAWLQMFVLYWIGGYPFLVWGTGVRFVCQVHATALVNSACHTWGVQTWNTGDLSRNNWFVAMFVFGEGWHNNHHAFDYSARHGLEWWQLDATWYVIKLLEYFGLAYNVRVPSKVHQEKMSF